MRRFRPFAVYELIGKHAIRMDSPEQIKIRGIVHVIHSTYYHEKLDNIPLAILIILGPVPAAEDEEYKARAIRKHRKRGIGYQFF